MRLDRAPATALVLAILTSASAKAVETPRPSAMAPTGTQETAVLAGGCFWGVQGVYRHVRGVTRVTAGYAGGKATAANYATVSTGFTGHAESVRIEFDPRQISYVQILRIFFSVVADPTEKDFQGPDQGPQYRTDIFAVTPTQAAQARAFIAALEKARVFKRPIVTRVDPYTGFFPAEAYHQGYLERHPDAAYIVINDAPKVAALKRVFPQLWQAKPAPV